MATSTILPSFGAGVPGTTKLCAVYWPAPISPTCGRSRVAYVSGEMTFGTCVTGRRRVALNPMNTRRQRLTRWLLWIAGAVVALVWFLASHREYTETDSNSLVISEGLA